MPIINHAHTGIIVSSLETSIIFYRDVLGLDYLDRWDHPDPSLKLAFMGLNETIFIELVEGYNSDLPQEGKVHHLALTVTAIEQDIARLKAENVIFDEEGLVTLPNGARSIFFYGPDGELLELLELPKTKK